MLTAKIEDHLQVKDKIALNGSKFVRTKDIYRLYGVIPTTVQYLMKYRGFPKPVSNYGRHNWYDSKEIETWFGKNTVRSYKKYSKRKAKTAASVAPTTKVAQLAMAASPKEGMGQLMYDFLTKRKLWNEFMAEIKW